MKTVIRDAEGNTTMKTKTLIKLLDDYLERLESLKYSGITRRTIYYNCFAFIRWMVNTHGAETPDNIRKVHLAGWQKHLNSRRTGKGMPLKARSINKKIENVKGMIDRFYVENRIKICNASSNTILYINEQRIRRIQL